MQKCIFYTIRNTSILRLYPVNTTIDLIFRLLLQRKFKYSLICAQSINGDLQYSIRKDLCNDLVLLCTNVELYTSNYKFAIYINYIYRTNFWGTLHEFWVPLTSGPAQFTTQKEGIYTKHCMTCWCSSTINYINQPIVTCKFLECLPL